VPSGALVVCHDRIRTLVEDQPPVIVDRARVSAPGLLNLQSLSRGSLTTASPTPASVGASRIAPVAFS
jgi:hypothetical protein